MKKSLRKNQENEIEIDVWEFFKLLYINKKTIFFSFIVFVVIGMVYYVFAEKKYRITVLISPPKKFQETYLVSAKSIERVIYVKRLRDRIVKKLRIKDESIFDFSVTVRKDKLINLSLYTNKKNIKNGKLFINYCIQELRKEYDPLLKSYSYVLEKEIYKSKREIELAKLELDLIKQNIKEVEKLIKFFENKQKETKSYYKEVNESKALDLKDYYYKSGILDSFSNILVKRYKLDVEKRNLILEEKERKKNIFILEFNLKDLNFKKANLKNINVVAPIKVSEKPVKPDLFVILVICAFLGFLSGILFINLNELRKEEKKK